MKLIRLSYKVKKTTMINQFYKRKILITGFAIVHKKKKQIKTPNTAQHRATTTTSQSMVIE